MRKAAGGTDCVRCHEPLARLIEPDHPAARDGVSCEGCHTTAVVEVAAESATFRLRPEERTKYGPLCDAVDHYFHKMGCSPLHGESQFCAGCHHLTVSLRDGAKVRVLGEYDEWRESPQSKKGVSCQDCHMPWDVAPLAAGSAARVNASHHGFRGDKADLRQRSLTVNMTIGHSDERLTLEVLLKNSGAGHFVPTGTPDHRVVIEAATVDASDHEIDRGERSYGKMLVDEEGRAAPFFSAAKQASDTRLAPEEARKETFDLSAPARATAVKLQVVFIDMAPDIARAIAYEPVREIMYEEKRALKVRPGSPVNPRTTKQEVNR